MLTLSSALFGDTFSAGYNAGQLRPSTFICWLAGSGFGVSRTLEPWQSGELQWSSMFFWSFPGNQTAPLVAGQKLRGHVRGRVTRLTLANRNQFPGPLVETHKLVLEKF
jgi:hypothetical protein